MVHDEKQEATVSVLKRDNEMHLQISEVHLRNKRAITPHLKKSDMVSLNKNCTSRRKRDEKSDTKSDVGEKHAKGTDSDEKTSVGSFTG